jgi:hypothetical protein
MANYMQPGAQFGTPGSNLTQVTTEGGRSFKVHSAAAPNFQGFVEDLERQGMPVGEVIGFANRNIAHSSRMSQHAMGNAVDIGSQSARDVIAPESRAWIQSHPKEWRASLNKWGMESGGDWRNPDLGHVEWTGKAPPTDTDPTGAQIASRIASRLSDGSAAGAEATARASDAPFNVARGSWFGQYGYGRFNDGNAQNVWRDTGDNAQNKSGLPQTTPGIALPQSSTLGHYYEVIAPNGQRMVVRQVDQGPGRWTGRGIDINAPAAEMAGYNPKSFPTDAKWSYRHIGEKLPSGMVAGIQGKTQVASAGPKPLSTAYWNQGKVQPGETQVAARVPAQGAQPQVARRYEREPPPDDARP